MDALVILARTFPAAFWIVVALIALCMTVSLPALFIGKAVTMLGNRPRPSRTHSLIKDSQTLPYRVGRAYRKLKRLATFLPFG